MVTPAEKRRGVPHGPSPLAGTRSTPRRTAIAVALGFCALAHVLATRWSWSGIPLQTDTGMWAYIGGRILDGALPYRDLWESKPPGIYYTFALVEWAFGTGGDRALLWMDAVLSVAVFGVTYAVARRFVSRVPAAGAVLLLSLVFCHRVLADWGDNVEKFVALFEMLACWVVLRCLGGRGVMRHWIAAGVCCGLAGLFKQTGVLFLVAATVGVLLLRRGASHPPAEHPPAEPGAEGGFHAVAGLWLGAMGVWLPIMGWMLTTGIWDEFWQQVVRYDLARVGSGEEERSRLLDPQHWSDTWKTLKLTLVLFGPALVGACCWVRRRRLADNRTTGTRDATSPDRLMLLVVVYWLLTAAVFPIAPYGYGHYLLQASPPAAVLAAWVLDWRIGVRLRRAWAAAAVVMIGAGLLPLRDHFGFTFNTDGHWRAAYAQHAERLDGMVADILARTTGRQSVMLWPPDYTLSGYAVLYYAGRSTPLEMSNADVIFKGKIDRLRPPMPELLARLRARPPDVIADWTPVNVELSPTGEPHLLTPRGGFSLAEAPDDDHEMPEGRALAPLKRWVRGNYGGQQRVGVCTFYFRGRPWRLWQGVLLPPADPTSRQGRP